MEQITDEIRLKFLAEHCHEQDGRSLFVIFHPKNKGRLREAIDAEIRDALLLGSWVYVKSDSTEADGPANACNENGLGSPCGKTAAYQRPVEIEISQDTLEIWQALRSADDRDQEKRMLQLWRDGAPLQEVYERSRWP